MKISELPEKNKRKALEYQKNAVNPYYDKNTDNLEHAFSWKQTEEGPDYWAELSLKDKKESNALVIFIVIFSIIALLIFTL